MGGSVSDVCVTYTTAGQ